MPADTPALDALLREVDRCEADRRAYGACEVRVPDAPPRLAAIVRVLVEAVNQAASFGEGPVVGPEFDCPYHAMEARHALARAEAIAKGE